MPHKKWDVPAPPPKPRVIRRALFVPLQIGISCPENINPLEMSDYLQEAVSLGWDEVDCDLPDSSIHYLHVEWDQLAERGLEPPVPSTSEKVVDDEIQKVLEEFCECIELTGGVVETGVIWEPVGDRSWSALGAVYRDACRILNRDPRVKDEEGEEET